MKKWILGLAAAVALAANASASKVPTLECKLLTEPNRLETNCVIDDVNALKNLLMGFPSNAEEMKRGEPVVSDTIWIEYSVASGVKAASMHSVIVRGDKAASRNVVFVGPQASFETYPMLLAVPGASRGDEYMAEVDKMFPKETQKVRIRVK